MNYTALIVAAGSGTRVGLGYNKVLYKFKNGKTILEQTIDNFKQDMRCRQLVVVTSGEDIETFKTLCQDDAITFVIGGNTRQQSVYNGLQEVREDYVLVHDGARPWLSLNCIDRIIATLETEDACLLCVNVKDTIKEVKDGYIVQTFERSCLRQAQTPQAFKTKLIISSYQKALHDNIAATDDAQIVELCSGVKVKEVEGSYENSKVTTIEDLEGK
ncbi:MAG: 2-C-methyl-D-erythritol 4-phosphate cytidylyltransferase [Longicatena sp.]